MYFSTYVLTLLIFTHCAILPTGKSLKEDSYLNKLYPNTISDKCVYGIYEGIGIRNVRSKYLLLV